MAGRRQTTSLVADGPRLRVPAADEPAAREPVPPSASCPLPSAELPPAVRELAQPSVPSAKPVPAVTPSWPRLSREARPAARGWPPAPACAWPEYRLIHQSKRKTGAPRRRVGPRSMRAGLAIIVRPLDYSPSLAPRIVLEKVAAKAGVRTSLQSPAAGRVRKICCGIHCGE